MSQLSIILEQLKDSMIHFDCIDEVVLLGSASRGEETWFKSENKELLASDIELLVLTNSAGSVESNKQRILRAIKQIEEKNREYCAKTFHIDASFKKTSHLKFTDKRFINFEISSSGVEILKKTQVLKKMPNINCSNLNYSELHAIFIHRLVALIKTSRLWKEDKISESECKTLFCRNGLDLLSVLLPHYGFLIAGYSARATKIEQIIMSKSKSESDEVLEKISSDTARWLMRKKDTSYVIEEDIPELARKILFYMNYIKSIVSDGKSKRFYRYDKRLLLKAIMSCKIENIVKELGRGTIEENLDRKLRIDLLLTLEGVENRKFRDSKYELRSLYSGAY